MSNFARIINDVAVDVSADPQNSFHPDIAAEFVAVPDNVRAGWIKGTDGKWGAPAPTPEPVPAVVYPKVSPIHFQMLFHSTEVVAADELKATDKVLAAFWKLVDDPRTDTIDLNLTTVQNAIEYTLTVVKAAGVTLDVQQRKAEILTGELK